MKAQLEWSGSDCNDVKAPRVRARVRVGVRVTVSKGPVGVDGVGLHEA